MLQETVNVWKETAKSSVKETLALLFFLIVNNDHFLRFSFQSADKDNKEIFRSTVYIPFKNTHALDQRFSSGNSDESAEDFNGCANVIIQLMSLCKNTYNLEFWNLKNGLHTKKKKKVHLTNFMIIPKITNAKFSSCATQECGRSELDERKQ